MVVSCVLSPFWLYLLWALWRDLARRFFFSLIPKRFGDLAPGGDCVLFDFHGQA